MAPDGGHHDSRHPDPSHPGSVHPEPGHPDEELVIPALLRAARGSYGDAIRAHLAAAGFDDLPRNSAYVLGGMGNYGAPPAGELVRELRVSKQAASQLIDTLVLRGYLDRSIHPVDRRRMVVELTDRGRAAAIAVGDGRRSVDAQLAEICTPEELAGLRAGLTALAAIRDRAEPARAGH
ncbi:MAG TPA: MarR family transcriptional regulator [Acidimicrobiales bacterium]|nr:MarR family transcriptional regulator [Acidimicrobiales bacterium]